MNALWERIAPERWSLGWRCGVVPLGCALLFSLLGLSWRVLPLYAEWQAGAAELPALQQRYQNALVELKQLAELSAEINVLEQQLTTQGGAFSLDALPLEALQRAAQAQGLQVHSVRWLPRQTEHWPFSQTLHLQISGSYAGFLRWLQHLDDWPGLISVHEVQIRPRVEAGLDFSLQLRFYQPLLTPSAPPLLPPVVVSSVAVPNPFFRPYMKGLSGWRWVGVVARGQAQQFLFEVAGRSQTLILGDEIADSAWRIAALREGSLWLQHRDETAEQRMLKRPLGALLDEAGSAEQ